MDNHYFWGIPYVIWSAVIASFLMLMGVYFTNRNSRKQLEMKLEYDARQQDREREMSLRINIYIDSTEAIFKAHLVLVKLANLDISDQELSNIFSENSATIVKINVIANNTTVQTVSNLTTKLATTYLDLSLQRFSLIERKNEISILQKMIERSQKELERLLIIMKELDLKGYDDSTAWDAVAGQHKFEQKQLDGFFAEIETLKFQQGEGILKFTKECFDDSIQVGELMPPALFAIREELELPIDKEAYLNVINESTVKSTIAIDKFIATIKQKISSE